MSLNRNIFYSFITQFPNLFFGIITGVFMTRIMGPEGRGVYSIFQANIDFFVLFLGVNINTGLTYYISSKKIALNKLVGISVITVALATVVIFAFIAVLFLFKSRFLFPENYDTLFFIGYFILSFIIGLINVCFSGIFSGYKNFRIINASSIGLSVLKLIFFAIAFYCYHSGLFKINIVTVFALLLAVQVATFLLNLLLYWHLYSTPPTFKFNYTEDVKPLFKYLGVSHTAQIVNFLNYRLDVWLVTYFKGLEQLGYYTLAVNIAQFTWLVSIPLSSVLFPYLSEDKGENSTEVLGKYSRLNCTALIFVAGLLYFVSDFLILHLYGTNFSESVLPLKILLIGNFFLMVQRPFRSLLFAKNDTTTILYINLVGLVFTLILDIILIPSQGIIGASIASDVTYISMLICILVYCFKKYHLKSLNYMILTKGDVVEGISFIKGKLQASK